MISSNDNNANPKRNVVAFGNEFCLRNCLLTSFVDCYYFEFEKVEPCLGVFCVHFYSGLFD